MTFRTLAVGVGMFALTDCAVASRVGSGWEGDADEMTVEVANDHWSEVDVFLMHGDVRRRLGRVQGGAMGRFLVPARLLVSRTDLRLRVETTDLSGTWSSEPISAERGRGLAFRVAPNVSGSSRVW